MKKTLIFLTLCIIYSLQITNMNSTENLLQNPGFENEVEGTPVFWEKEAWNLEPNVTKFSLVSDIKKSGSKSVLIDNMQENDSRISQTVKLEKKSYYKFSCWLKTENVSDSGRGAILSFKGRQEASEVLKGTNDWTNVEVFIETGKNVSDITLTIGLGGYGGISKGKLWIDDAEFIQIKTLPENITPILINNVDEKQKTNEKGKFKVQNLVFILIVILSIIVLIFIILKLKSNKKDEE